MQDQPSLAAEIEAAAMTPMTAKGATADFDRLMVAIFMAASMRKLLASEKMRDKARRTRRKG